MPVARLPITHMLTPSQLQSALLSQLAQTDKRAGQRFAGGSRKAVTQRQTFYLDDLHLAATSSRPNGDPISPVLKLVTFAASQKALADTARNFRHDLHGVRFLASCTPDTLPSMFPLLGSVFAPVPLLPLSDEALHRMFSRSIQLWLQQFPTESVGDQEALSEVYAYIHT